MVASRSRSERQDGRSPLRSLGIGQEVEVTNVKRPSGTNWFEAEQRPSRPDPDDLLHAGALDLITIIARDVTARLPVCAFNVSTMTYDISTAVATRSGTTRIQARVSRSLKDFARLRRELLVVLPDLSSVINLSDLSNFSGGGDRGGQTRALLSPLPSRTLKRRSTQRAVSRDVRTLSSDGTANWYASKEGALTAWIRDTLRSLGHCLALAGQSTDPSRLEARAPRPPRWTSAADHLS